MMHNEHASFLKKWVFPFLVVMSFVITSVMLTLLTLPPTLLQSGNSINNEVIRLLILIIFNAICHLSFYLLDAYYAKGIDKKHQANNTFGILKRTVLVIVSFYTFIIIVKDGANFLALVDPPNKLIAGILTYDLVFFTLGSLLMVYLVISLGQSLNNVYKDTRAVVNIAVVIWLVKIGNNSVIRIFLLLSKLDSISSFAMLYNIFNNIALVYNLALLLCALIIISKNKFPNGKLWLMLAFVQVSNFIINIGFNVSNNEGLVSVQAGLNVILLILKLIFVFLIISAYVKPVQNHE